MELNQRVLRKEINDTVLFNIAYPLPMLVRLVLLPRSLSLARHSGSFLKDEKKVCSILLAELVVCKGLYVAEC